MTFRLVCWNAAFVCAFFTPLLELSGTVGASIATALAETEEIDVVADDNDDDDDDDDDDDSPIQQCARRQLLQKAPKHLSHLS